MIALRRFGLGARPGDIERIKGDARGYLASQLGNPKVALLSDPDLEASHSVFSQSQRLQKEQKALRESQKLESAPSASAGSEPGPARQPPMPMPPGKPMPQLKPGAIRREAFLDEVSARIDRAIATETPFLERLVYFWSNHFCVSVTKGPVRGLAGAYEREVIRPHILGRFSDMLLASAKHPAMLIYLDNHISIGPNSQAGKNRGRGLNENLAREILELHTLGVDGGYTQGDVTNLARILTGWTVGNVDQPNATPGKFFFAPPRHEPGAWSVLGKRYEDKGLASGEDMLSGLARHPSTAKHVARKLTRHFLADDAPQGLIDRLASTFMKTGGDLAAVTKALIASPEVWDPRPRKIAPPFDFSVSLVRGFGVRPKAAEIARIAAALGQPTWAVPSPKGWPDDDHAWMGPSAIRERLRIAEFMTREVDKSLDPRNVAEVLFGDALSDETRQAVSRAESRDQGIELLVMAPEFLRR